jgi:hypothetical protein
LVIPEVKTGNKTYYILLFVLGLMLIIPVMDTKILPGHDHIFHISRIEAFAEALKEGVFPVRMCVDQVQFWGAPTGIFYPSLFSYIPALLRIAGIPIEICYNIFIALIVYLGLFASCHGFSLLTRSKHIGFLSSILYISSGYYLFSAHMRNALGEAISLAVMPLAIACIIRIVSKTKVSRRIYLLAIFSISAVIESHVLNSVFLALFGICYTVINYKKLTFTKCKQIFFLSVILVLLNASFIIPFLYFYKEVPLNIHFINEFTRYGFTPTTLFKFIIFWNSWLVIALYVFFKHNLFNTKNTSNYKRKQFKYYFSYFVLGSLFIFASSSAFPWDYLQPLKELFKVMQFPWRFLGPASLFLSVCGGFGLHLFLKKININQNKLVAFSILICLYHFLAFTYLTPLKYYGNWDMYEKRYWTRKPFFSDEDYLYRDMDIVALYKQGNNYLTDAKITNWKKTLTDISFTYEAPIDTKIILPLINYPGYIAINQTGKPISVTEDDNHMMVIALPKDNGAISIQYKPMLFRAADIISLITLAILIYQMGWIYVREKWNRLV